MRLPGLAWDLGVVAASGALGFLLALGPAGELVGRDWVSSGPCRHLPPLYVSEGGRPCLRILEACEGSPLLEGAELVLPVGPGDRVGLVCSGVELLEVGRWQDPSGSCGFSGQ